MHLLAHLPPHWIGDVDIDPFNENNAWFITGYGVFNSGNMAAAVPTWTAVSGLPAGVKPVADRVNPATLNTQ